ncbi:carboxymuconolactone decarboxylase family protein [Parafrankia discariae]|uniref:carboxymuconolactone decarboxylase family protein n=1 Tax=Parafrankia discariae TaxID=365528 RepID=UPI00037EFCE2|nr:carboxymuconolactone decarboxylase family protein [Parafrankia discariae]
MARLSPVARGDAPAHVQAIYDDVFSPGRDPVAEPGTATGSAGDFWTVLANVPEIIVHARTFANDFVRSNARELTRSQRELVIVRAAFNIESKFEYSQHRKFLRATGYPENKAAEIPVWTTSTVFAPDERALLGLADEISLGRGRSQDATYERLREHFPETAVLEAAYIAAQYVMFGLLCRSLRLEYDATPERCEEVSSS